MVIMLGGRTSGMKSTRPSFQGRELEEGKAFAIIKVTIHMSFKEIVLVINKADSLHMFHTHRLTSPATLVSNARHLRFDLQILASTHIIVREDHVHIMTTFR